MPWCLLASVVCLAPYFLAVWRYKRDSPGSRNFESASASSIGAMIVKLSHFEILVLWCCWYIARSGALRARTRYHRSLFNKTSRLDPEYNHPVQRSPDPDFQVPYLSPTGNNGDTSSNVTWYILRTFLRVFLPHL